MIKTLRNFYRPQRSCGQGNIFTPVCHSVHRGGGIPQGTKADPLPEQTPSGKQTLSYGLREAGTHPTGMHSCYDINLDKLPKNLRDPNKKDRPMTDSCKNITLP